MATTKLVSENENNIRSAVTEGISGEAVEATLEDVINTSDFRGKTPIQVKNTVEAIADMKSNVDSKRDESYASELFKENGERIQAAINDGITPQEVAITLVNATNNSDTKKGKGVLSFFVKLISKMKVKDIKLHKAKDNVEEKGYQKVYTDK